MLEKPAMPPTSIFGLDLQNFCRTSSFRPELQFLCSRHIQVRQRHHHYNAFSEPITSLLRTALTLSWLVWLPVIVWVHRNICSVFDLIHFLIK